MFLKEHKLVPREPSVYFQMIKNPKPEHCLLIPPHCRPQAENDAEVPWLHLSPGRESGWLAFRFLGLEEDSGTRNILSVIKLTSSYDPCLNAAQTLFMHQIVQVFSC